MRAAVRYPIRVVAAVLIPCAVACQPDRQQAGTLQNGITDSAGIRIIENHRPPEGSRLAWRIGPEPFVSIGRREGDERYLLHEVSGSFRMPDGRIVVANRGTQEVRVFDALGNHLATMGGKGEGPGEFGSLGEVQPWPGDSILAWDFRGFGISIFDADGSYGRTFFLRSGADYPGDGPTPGATRADGTIFSVDELWYGVHGIDPASPVTADSARVEAWDGEGRRLGSLGYQPDEEVSLVRRADGGAEWGADAFSAELVTAPWGDFVIAGPNKPYEIRAFRVDGGLARIVRLEHEPRTPTEADHEAYVERMAGPMDSYIEPRTGLRIPEAVLNELRQFYAAVPLAEHFPAFSAILADATGHLWVREYDAPRDGRPAPLWTVFDPDGRVLGYVETPRGLLVQQIGADFILGHIEDELGVEYVQVWPLERSGA